MRSPFFEIILIGFVAASWCLVGQAQQRPVSKDGQADISSLKQNLENIDQQQRQILTELAELKKTLQMKSGIPPGLERPASLDVDGERFVGSSQARVAIIEYADFECPYCGEFEREVYPQLFTDYIKTGKVRYFYRDLPLPMHAHAMTAAQAARCAGEQGKYWEMHDSLFARQNALSPPALLDRAKTLGLDMAKFSQCLSSQKYTADIEKSVPDAQRMGIDGTPAFFLGTVEPNGDVTIEKRFMGAAPFEVFKSELDALLAAKTEPVSGH